MQTIKIPLNFVIFSDCVYGNEETYVALKSLCHCDEVLMNRGLELYREGNLEILKEKRKQNAIEEIQWHLNIFKESKNIASDIKICCIDITNITKHPKNSEDNIRYYLELSATIETKLTEDNFKLEWNDYADEEGFGWLELGFCMSC